MGAQTLDWGNILLLFGSFTGIVIALGSAWKAVENAANFFLVAFLIVCTFGILLKFLDQTNYISQFPPLIRLNQPLGLLRPPLFYLYIFFALTQSKVKITTLLHLLPAVVMIILLLPALQLQVSSMARSVFGLFYSTAYLLLSWQLYRTHSNQHGLTVELRRWIRLLLIGYAIFLTTAISIFVFDQTHTTSYIVFQVLSILIVAVCVKLLQFPSTKRMPLKYGKSALSAADKAKYMASIQQQMIREQPYTRESFRLTDLAELVQLPEHVVSQVINEKTGVSFPDFVNQFRVEKAKQLLTDAKYGHLTLEALGAEAGFNSKASFYTAFKRFAGTTPGDFQKASRQ